MAQKLQVFQYIVLLHPTEEEAKAGKKTEIIKDITTDIAEDQKILGMKIVRALPEEVMGKLTQIDIVIRNF